MLLNVVLEKILASPLDCEPIHQSILKEINPGCSLEGLMLKLKLQYLGHLTQGAPGKSGPHASGEGERVIAPEPW